MKKQRTKGTTLTSGSVFLGKARHSIGASIPATSYFIGLAFGRNIGSTTNASGAQRYDELTDVWEIRSPPPTATNTNAAFALNGKGYTTGGDQNGAAVDTTVNEQYTNPTDTWASKAEFTTIRESHACFSLRGYGYVIGGVTWITSTYLKSTYKYSDITNTWTNKADISTGRQALSGMVIKSSIGHYGYVVGGTEPGVVNTVEQYDDSADTWSLVDTLNTARGDVAAFTLNNKGYAAGGWTGAANSAVTEQYDDLSNTWTNKANINSPRRDHGAFTGGSTYGYTINGTDNATATYSRIVERYNDVTNTWAYKSFSSIRAHHPGCCGINVTTKPTNTSEDYGYICGGSSSTGIKSEVENYLNDINAILYVTSLLIARYAADGFTANGLGHLCAGGGGATNRSDQYTKDGNTWTNKANMNVGRDDNPGAFTINNIGYVCGGAIGAAASDDNESYDTSTNVWTIRADMNTAVWATYGSSLNNLGYIVGGYFPANNTDKNQQYTPTSNTWTLKQSLTDAIRSGGLRTVSGKLYYAFGFKAAVTQECKEYNDSTNIWTIKTSGSTQARQLVTAWSIDDGLNITAGIDGGNVDRAENERYLPLSDTWSTKVSCQVARYARTGFTISNKD